MTTSNAGRTALDGPATAAVLEHPQPPFVELASSSPRSPSCAPAISLLVATRNSLAQLQACLRAIDAQTAEASSMEVVVIDEGSTDGTPDWLANAELRCAHRFLRLEERGAPRATHDRRLEALRVGLNESSAPLVLFLDDDAAATAGLVQAHLDLHAELERSGTPAIVSGACEDPPEARESGLRRWIDERRSKTDGPSTGREFTIGNTSVSSAALRAVGGFDPQLAGDAAIADLGLRLAASGLSTVERANLRATRQQTPSFDQLRQRERARGHGQPLLFRKHPQLLEQRNDLLQLSSGALAAELERNREVLERGGRVVRNLARTKLTEIARVGGEFAATAQTLEGVLTTLAGPLQALWRAEGCQHGLRELGLRDLRSLLLDAPLELEGVSGKPTLLRAVGEASGQEAPPAWIRAALGWLERHAEDGERTLLVWPDVESGWSAQRVERELLPTLARHFRSRPHPRVALLEHDLSAGGELRLFAGLSSWISDSPDAPERALARELEVTIEESAALTAGLRDAWAIGDDATLRVGAWPDWSQVEELAQLVKSLEPFVDDERVGVFLHHDPERDGSLEAASAALAAEFDRQLLSDDSGPASAPDLAVLLETRTLGQSEWQRVGLALDAWIQLPPGELPAPANHSRQQALTILAGTGIELLADPAASAAWLSDETARRAQLITRTQRVDAGPPPPTDSGNNPTGASR